MNTHALRHALNPVLLLTLLLALCPVAHAHEGHDHDDAPLPVLAGNQPQRLPDGSVFIPKSAQRAMGVLTAKAALASVPRTLELPGRVIMDPHLGGRVQAMLSGRIEAAGPHGLPSAGHRVKKGEILAWVVPAAGAIERANQAALLAELKASRGLAERRLARLRELADTVPKKDIEAAESELKSLHGRSAAVSQSLSGREALIAPVSGILAASNAVIGQVVEPRELIFEIVAPDSLHVEATAFEAISLNDVVSASLSVGERVVPLNFIGAPRRLREQSLPLLFENHATGAGLSLPLGQAVKVQVQLRSTAEGLPVPTAALSRNSANQTVLWVKTAPERFAPRLVRSAPIDGQQVLIKTGEPGALAAGERVVVQGASLIAQVR